MTAKAKVEFRELDDGFFVSGQITPRDIPNLKKLGFRTLINNRPDYETPGQPTSQRLAQSADQSGLSYYWIPISGEISESDVDKFTVRLDESLKPIFAFCRSGARCARLWALCQTSHRPVPEIAKITKKAGHDISDILPQIYERETNGVDPYRDLL